ncbi:MAG: hypothetical protein M9898_04890 [Chitinophagaceae bacterium]|nr:hypothetical protein [Chitinophagaceae bacterium]
MSKIIAAILKAFLVIYFLSYLLLLPLFFIFKRKNKEAVVRVIFYYILYIILQEFLTFMVTFTPGLRSFIGILYSSNSLVEFSFFCAFYYFLFPREHKIRKITVGAWIGFILFSLGYFQIYGNKENYKFGSFVAGIEALLLMLLCGYYLYFQITHTFNMFVYRTFNFWIIVTFFLFVSSTFFLYLMADSMANSKDFQKYYMYINSGANILKNLLLAFAITRKFVQAPEKDYSRPELDLDDDLILNHKT